jgi:hypothetical protein
MDDSVSAEMPCSQPVLRNAPLDAHPLRGQLEPAGREGHAVFLRHGHPSRPQDLMPPEIPKDCLASASLLWQTLALLHNCIVAILKKSISNIEYTLDAYPARQQQKPWYAAGRLHLRSGQRSDILPGQPGVPPPRASESVLPERMGTALDHEVPCTGRRMACAGLMTAAEKSSRPVQRTCPAPHADGLSRSSSSKAQNR